MIPGEDGSSAQMDVNLCIDEVVREVNAWVLGRGAAGS